MRNNRLRRRIRRRRHADARRSACSARRVMDPRDAAGSRVRPTSRDRRSCSRMTRAVSSPTFLKTGRPERRMPAFSLTDAEVADLYAFIRSVAPPPGRGGGGGRGVITAVVVGDAKAGEAHFNGAGGCTACHSPTGDFKGIGTRLTAAAIQGRLVLPRGNGGYPPSLQFAARSERDAARTVTVTQPSGETIAGTLMWITDFNVTLVRRVRNPAHLRARRRRAEGRGQGSAPVAPRSPAHADRQEHARPDRVPGDAEMKRTVALTSCRRCWRCRSVSPRRARSIRRCCSKPPTDAWPSYHGDYTGRHFSPLKQVDVTNAQQPVARLDLPHATATTTARSSAGPLAAAPAGPRRRAAGAAAGPIIKAMPLMVNGILYLSAPNHVYAVDARTGQAALALHVARPRARSATAASAMLGDCAVRA